jgi:ferredoxin-thioredoxin reductase catalytic subunit
MTRCFHRKGFSPKSELYRKTRRTWAINPVTRRQANIKTYNRKRNKQFHPDEYWVEKLHEHKPSYGSKSCTDRCMEDIQAPDMISPITDCMLRDSEV